jgi:hypothetical protein
MGLLANKDRKELLELQAKMVNQAALATMASQGLMEREAMTGNLERMAHLVLLEHLEHLVRRVTQVNLELQDNLGKTAIQVPQGTQAEMERMANLVWTENLALLALPVPLVVQAPLVALVRMVAMDKTGKMDKTDVQRGSFVIMDLIRQEALQAQRRWLVLT